MKRENLPRLTAVLAVSLLVLAFAPSAYAAPVNAPVPAPSGPELAGWASAGYILQGNSLNAVAMAPGNPADGWIVGDNGKVFHYNGATWNIVNTGTITNNLNAVFPLPHTPNQAWAVGNEATILYCNATSCTKEAAPGTTRELDSIWMTSDTDAWVVGANGQFLHYTGGAWQSIVVPGVTVQMHDIQMFDVNDGFAVGEGSTVLRYSAGTWTPVGGIPTLASGSLIGLWFNSTTEGWVVGGTSGIPVILHYLNGVWNQETSPVNTRLWYVYMFGDGTGYAVANGGNIFQRTTAGVWEVSYVVPGLTAPPMYGVWMDSVNDGWAVAGDGSAYHYTGSGVPPNLPLKVYVPVVFH